MASGHVGGGEGEGEEQDDSSSSSLQREVPQAPNNLRNVNAQENDDEEIQEEEEDAESDDELAMFRQQWQRELELSPTPPSTPTLRSRPAVKPEADPLGNEEKAKQLFLQAVELERSGKLYEAVQHYKRAIQILPDIEMRIYEELRSETPEDESLSEKLEPVDIPLPNDEEALVDGESLLTRLRRNLARERVICEPEYTPKGIHLSWMPYELILLIIRWVVSSELDAPALERLAEVCRGLYVIAREPDIWRSMCVKTWGIDCGSLRASGYSSWRQMYIRRPRLHLNGCYISKTTYVRHGENSFQDQTYRPWYLINYFRYLRFFAEGLVLMWTTSEEPATSVGYLKYRNPKPGLGITAGHYRHIGDKIVIVIKKAGSEKTPQVQQRYRRRGKEAEPQEDEQTFHMEFELGDVRGRRSVQLCWRSYSVSVRRDQWTEFELTSAKFPPLAFSRVRSYTADTYAPLLCARHHTRNV